MTSILIGLETEYGFTVEGRGTINQIEDSMALVRTKTDKCFIGWDYRNESPRADLRGFSVQALRHDPEDAKFDQPSDPTDAEIIRSDRVLCNGARFYNDHGHPEYATPECTSIKELLHNELAGDRFVFKIAQDYAESIGKEVRVFKNNTDFNGASFGSHESYLVPRSIGFERLYKSVTPILIARQIVCGAGKVGAEKGARCDFQISQRADFLVESARVDTLYSRPVFNTRDEPHADRNKWIRLHVIAGDSNRLAFATEVKFALVKIAIWLEEIEKAPTWELSDPPSSFQAVSRDLSCKGRVGLQRGQWTDSIQILESYVEGANHFLDQSIPEVNEAVTLGNFAIDVILDHQNGGDKLRRNVDWAAKHHMLQEFVDSEGTNWRDSALFSYDLAYHDLNPNENLFDALLELGRIDHKYEESKVLERMKIPGEKTRSLARSIAVTKWPGALESISWEKLTFKTESGRRNVNLDPSVKYSRDLELAETPDDFCNRIEEMR